jgi:hypothetical protein
MASVTAVVTFLGISLAVSAGTATADPVLDLQCEVTGDVEFDPGVNVFPRDFNVDGSAIVTDCVDLTMASPHVLSGTLTLTGTGNAACTPTTLGGSADVTVNITWLLSDASTDASTVALHVQATAIPPTFVVQGVVTAGRFVGDTARATLLAGQANLSDCLTDEGVTQASGTLAAFLYSIP